MLRSSRLGLAGLVAFAAAASAQAPRAAIDQLSPGNWMLHEIGSRGPDRALCVRDAGALLQIHHPGLSCARFVVADEPRAVTVHYTCPGAGHGRTTLTVEAPSRVRIATQGLARGAPFDVEYAAQRDGTCAASDRN
ncbi:hypothetical protein [Sphingomonas sp. TZW2008]|uniref:hypothetical protein n=1 Tax=Sphingomonas sp. TZW2008 TaxID=1917973 RepID=UPI000A26C966|nr:hypothetical protein [Sphingomonas sp. TZW2008]